MSIGHALAHTLELKYLAENRNLSPDRQLETSCLSLLQPRSLRACTFRSPQG